ncbi:MAG: NAD(P)/FAD-dependent oxidoreductase [Myxococcota bacterium]
MQRIVIIGGGFAGADLARRLQHRLPSGWEILLYSRENHFVFTPLLPEVVGAAINPLHVVWPIREMARGATCRTAEVKSLDLEAKQIEYLGPDNELLTEEYDHLVLGCGLDVNLDLVPGMRAHGWALKTLGDAIVLRNHVIQQLERAEAEPHPEKRAEFLSFAVVGGGFTGVEVAGAIRDMLSDSVRFYKRFDREDIRVTILEAGPRVLGPLPESLSLYAQRKLESSGVDIRTGVAVSELKADGVVLGENDFLTAGTVIASIGNTMQKLLADSGLPNERGRILVEPTMQVKDHPGVWALGDCAAVPNAYDDRPSPTLGQFAVRQSKQLAANLLATIADRPTAPFSYHTRGMFAAIGHGRAVGNPFGIKITGFLAYMMWRGVYWSKMPSRARRIQIAFDWAWDLLFRRDIVELSTMTTHDRDRE